MPSLTCFNLRFTSSWWMILITMSCIALLVKLGFWQIQRAEEKKALLAAHETQLRQALVFWDSEKPFPEQYQKLQLKGTYLAHQFFLDNQHIEHEFGFHVLSPLLLEGGGVVVVDRGWVPGDPMRRVLPSVRVPLEVLSVQGSVYYPSKNNWLLGPVAEEKKPGTTILEGIDVRKMSQILQKKVHPFIIRLSKEDPYGFVREWAIVSMPPQRHLAYALQWFAMALLLLILFIVLNFKKQDGERDDQKTI